MYFELHLMFVLTYRVLFLAIFAFSFKFYGLVFSLGTMIERLIQVTRVF
jgi:hypothetical protein